MPVTSDTAQSEVKAEPNGKTPPEAPSATFANIEATAQANGGQYTPPAEYAGSFGRTVFDSPSSEDGLVTVVMPPKK